jgi:hypothetical protein
MKRVRFTQTNSVRQHAAQELCAELSQDGMVWADPPGEARGFGKHPKQIWEALVTERVENDGLLQWVDDLQSGMFINCVYCGHRYGPQDEVPASMADVLKQHIAQCPNHPMSELVRILEAASHGFKSYAAGNSATALAEEMAEACDRAIAMAKGGTA